MLEVHIYMSERIHVRDKFYGSTWNKKQGLQVYGDAPWPPLPKTSNCPNCGNDGNGIISCVNCH